MLVGLCREKPKQYGESLGLKRSVDHSPHTLPPPIQSTFSMQKGTAGWNPIKDGVTTETFEGKRALPGRQINVVLSLQTGSATPEFYLERPGEEISGGSQWGVPATPRQTLPPHPINVFHAISDQRLLYTSSPGKDHPINCCHLCSHLASDPPSLAISCKNSNQHCRRGH